MNYHYPSAYDIYPDRNQKSYRWKRLRFNIRSLWHAKYIKKFTAFANQQPELATFLNSRANYSYPLVHRFLDKRWNAEQRLTAICDNLTFLTQKFATQQTPLLQQKICFGEVAEDFAIYLNINEQQPMEGFWALELRQQSTQSLIYLLTFGKVADDLLIAAIQGTNTENGKDIIKQLTKQYHGLRPAYLMVEVMRLLTQALGYKQLLGIPHKYQNKSRLIQSKRYFVDYDTIFRESGGYLTKYWQLPLTIDKDLTHIASKKRSMYRKRFAMLEQLAQQINTLFAN
ncbi:VirK/YbjX family protein [[Haemophilus] ducreyi]|uniref:VirK/YbjX family protein n=1 Tax=Haemophilus ducreyi TaxID=730 RepID=UPI00065648DD|nr:VirK/YbjX family protein [[Haemophilus] ducreyi]AKO45558.1 membrane protein [[Haemophilus] ducreyi]AKO46945.1 membrane protein [[Haemophilus] ducreyi]AKO48288.1 membrane protein [[Haemophilus] ducreyi]AKO49676.1 membrane protein [[Haemophilus] ducreyi]ANF61280.1 hypothetical protein A6037_00065 [[Haemophilus] ducreyi]